jgi:hypothetical protein
MAHRRPRGLLATATRPTAIVLTACAAWAAWVAIRDNREWRALIAPVLTPLGAIAFIGYIGVHTGEPGAWWRVQTEAWSQKLDGGAALVDDVVHFVGGSRTDLDHVIVMMGLVTVVIGVILLLRSRMPAVYIIYTAGVLAMTLGSANLSARPRFVLAAFPLAIATAHQLTREVVAVLSACGAAVMALLVVWYTAGMPGIPP